MEKAFNLNFVKAIFFLFYFFIFLFAGIAWAQPNKECGDSHFKTEIIKFEKNESCFEIILEVSNDGQCKFELSHVNFDFGSGIISNASNSMGWPIELNHIDPTTGIGGIKIDDINNFGKDPDLRSFQVEFTFCADEISMEDKSYLNPVVAYKAGQCVYFENPVVEENSEDDTNDGEDDADDNNQEPSDLIVSEKKIDPSCNNETEGSIEIVVEGGTAPYEIVWSTGQIEFILQNLVAGTYLYTISDVLGQQIQGEVILENPLPFNIEAIASNPDCQGVNTGSIDLNIVGDNGPYAILWSDGSTDQNQTGLSAGPYTVTVTDASGCTANELVTLTNTTSISLNAVVVQPSCQEGISGSITLSASGGTGPYSYSWSNGMDGSEIYNLTDGYYRVNITDQNGCTYSKTYSIISDVGIQAFASVTKTNCFDDPIGEIDLTVSGGTEPYLIEWSNGSTDEDINELVSGNYTATITDAKGCQSIYKTSVTRDDININYNGVTIPSCNGGEDGSIDVSISNGSEPYIYSWSNGSTDEDISDLAADKYTVEVKDAKGCVSQKSFNIPEPAPVQISYDIQINECTGSQDIVVNATGGSMEFFYSWSDGSSLNRLNDVAPGIYTVTVTDSRSCTETQEIVVDELPQISACMISDLQGEVICGSAENIMMSSESNVISYSWSVSSSDGSWAISSTADQTQIEFTAGSAGSTATFTLNVQYEGGCESTCEKTIEVCTDESNNDGSGDDDSGDDGSDDDGSGDDGDTSDEDEDHGTNNEKECDECFYTNPVLISKLDDGFSYAIEVNHDDCRYDLSHLTIEIPSCFNIVDYSNSMNWKMGTVNNDPTTGLTGLKIDDIPSFGKDSDLTSFVIYLQLSSDDPDCENKLTCFTPVIAYKAATCVYEELTQSECTEGLIENLVSTYPNPTQDYIKVNLDKCDKSASYFVDLINCQGERIDSQQFQKGFDKECSIDLTSRKDGLYLVEVKGSNGFRSIHRVVKK